jgi:hypothetical protein
MDNIKCGSNIIKATKPLWDIGFVFYYPEKRCRNELSRKESDYTMNIYGKMGRKSHPLPS